MKASLVLFLLQFHAGVAWAVLAAGVPGGSLGQPRLGGVPTWLWGASGLLLGAWGAAWGEGDWGTAAGGLGLLGMGGAWWGLLRVSWGLHRTDQHAQIRMNQRLMDLRGQLARLEERERMRLRLETTRQSKDVMERTTDRFQAILVAVEHHIAYGDVDRAERIVTTFSKHLRQMLHEGSIPFLSLRDSLEFIQTHLDLMESLTAYRFVCELDEDALEPEHLVRCTESLRITPWVEGLLRPFYERAERSLDALDPVRIAVAVEANEVVFRAYFPERSAVEPVALRIRLLGQDYAEEQARAQRA